MNYLNQINCFYVEIVSNPLTSKQQALWHRLMAYCSSFGWKQGFTISNTRLIDDLKLSRRDLDDCRNILVQKGYIKYKKGKGNQCGEYTLVELKKPLYDQYDIQNDIQVDTQVGVQDDTQVGTQSRHSRSTLNKLNKTKLNKTNIKENNKKKIFKKPTVEEVKAYCNEKGYNINPKSFVDYYEAMEWKDVKGNPVKNWKGKVVTWNNNSNNKKSSEPKKECYNDPKKYEGKGWGC